MSKGLSQSHQRGGREKKRRGPHQEPSKNPGGMSKAQTVHGGVVHTVVCKPTQDVRTIKGTAKLDPQQAQPKIGRNDPCPCDSGQKHKRCCG